MNNMKSFLRVVLAVVVFGGGLAVAVGVGLENGVLDPAAGGRGPLPVVVARRSFQSSYGRGPLPTQRLRLPH